ncbi:MAG: hypothetical protein KDG89_17795 [Geminicoccaceae bacterium]|nr:hypothetical protein [Geminicoccaceae bacterium]
MDQPRKLPVWRTVKAAYGDVLRHWRLALRAVGLWAAVLVLIEGGWALFLDRTPAGGLPDAGAAARPLLVGLLSGLVWVLGSAAVAAFWHRRILHGDARLGVAAPFGRRAVRYLVVLGLIGLFVAVPVFMLALFGGLFGVMAGMAQGSEGFAAGAGTVVGVLVVALICVLFVRMQLVLPSVAADERPITLGESFRLTRGNVLRLLFSLFLQFLVALPFGFAIGALAAPLALMGLEVGLLIVSTLANFFFLLVGAAWLSLAYGHLSGRVPV